MNKEEINKRFDERFPDYLKEQWSHSAKRKADEIKSFLHQEMERAVAEREKEIVEMIKEMPIPNEYDDNTARDMQDYILSLLTKEK